MIAPPGIRHALEAKLAIRHDPPSRIGIGTADPPSTKEKTLSQAAPKTPSLAKRPGAAAPVTVTLKQVSAELAEKHALTKKDAEAILTDLVPLLTRHLKKGVRLRLTGLGILQIRHRAVRMGRNPTPGEAIKI